jgi:hypothetical protein
MDKPSVIIHDDRVADLLDKLRSKAPQTNDKTAKVYPFYVVMTDSFMSGWGKAKGGTSRYALGCSSMAEAKVVLANAQGRSEMKRASIVSHKPRARRDQYLSIVDRLTASRWYEPGAWVKK